MLAQFTRHIRPGMRILDGGEHDDTTLSGKRFWSWFMANTLQTFEIENVDL